MSEGMDRATSGGSDDRAEGARVAETGADGAYPTYDELLSRVEAAEDAACDGLNGCLHCELVVTLLRGGSISCPECGHINGIGHSCDDWRAYDAGRLTISEVDARWQARRPLPSASGPSPSAEPLTGGPLSQGGDLP